jgi:hypothetical protein
MKQKNGKVPDNQQQPKSAQAVEGEGSYTATRRYNAGLQEHLKTHDVEAEAESAREALEGDERKELEDAEARGKRGPAQAEQPSQQRARPQPQNGKR